MRLEIGYVQLNMKLFIFNTFDVQKWSIHMAQLNTNYDN